MANTTKYDRVRSRFICDQVKSLREKNLNARTLFDRCWNKIPDTLIRKLNAEDLLQYIRLHVLPGEISSIIPSKTKDGYKTKNPKSHSLEKFA
ncbi:hypothetical protein [Leptospira stimsonii]|uniref:Uncharacterized protein n=1 Tax=Leptospira stimsonii TaxID=2202203 RepID=A0A396Z805_9LEPT|nr:hypothetical protein [Leptospira stimsonii]RHX89874.1 hypothetical protein DLM75_13040 [Leptospira stimsonii]